MKSIEFTKMHGLGNDFMVIDNLRQGLELSPQQILSLSDRHTGIGFDQLLVVEPASVDGVEFDYRIFNADGTEVEHCGNGARCFARFVSDRGMTKNRSIRVNTCNGVITLVLQDNGEVMVQMGVLVFEPAGVPFLADNEALFYDLEVAGENFQVGAASVGNPHVLLQVDDVDSAEVERLGPLIESHPRFPRRVNVSFMQIIDRQNIRLRVFERGVGETQACGSGACAAVAIAHRQGKLDNSVSVTLPGGELKIHWPNEKTSIEMTGPCSTVFEGQTRM
ncbi:diaminopimelate epimerase [Granulosicoccus antarcticus]|uniref:Diaminopimelate epimerase n=1 Tax=Granulosicoccus antarcticus IMCC3135 TaxID=1192854 RepID=A0A2Z2NI45_9GAMM|nr:Diaminopimelate epimerase [Granulosicoccus antarcticus IMCC3135]